MVVSLPARQSPETMRVSIKSDKDMLNNDQPSVKIEGSYHLKSVVKSDIGLRREENQDSYGILEAANFQLFLVADGMGGVRGGAIASQSAIKVITECLRSRDTIEPGDLVKAVTHANTAVYEQGIEDTEFTGMGTTLVGLCFIANQLYVLNVGDSRAYRLQHGKIEQLTEDHTLVTELLRSGAISADQVENHPVSHMLTRSLGPAPLVDVDCLIYAQELLVGDVFLLCSDGLYNLVNKEDMAEALEEESLEVAAERLIELANSRGGTDNITVMLVEVCEGSCDSVVSSEKPVSRLETDRTVSDTLELKEGIVSEIARPEQAAKGQQKQTSDDQKYKQTEDREQESIGDPTAKIDLNTDERFAINQGSQGRRFQLSYLLGGCAVLLAVALAFQVGRTSSSRDESEAPELQVEAVSPQTPREKRVPAVVLQPDKDAPMVSDDEGKLARVVNERHLAATNGNNFVLEGSGASLSSADLANISERKKTLVNLIDICEKKLAAFDRPVSGDYAETLTQTEQREQKIRAELNRVRTDMDYATRRLSVWYGRRQRLQSMDEVQLAREVAVASEVVRVAQREFEEVTWAYLKAYENLRYDPLNEKQKQEVRRLLRKRNDLQDDLRQKIRNAIDVEISNSDHIISELTLERDRLEEQLVVTQRKREFVSVLLSRDQPAQERLRREIEEERRLYQTELTELDELVPGLNTSKVSKMSTPPKSEQITKTD